MAVASYTEMWPCKIFEAQVHGWPVTLSTSLIATGIPPSGLVKSVASACRRASSGFSHR